MEDRDGGSQRPARRLVIATFVALSTVAGGVLVGGGVDSMSVESPTERAAPSTPAPPVADVERPWIRRTASNQRAPAPTPSEQEPTTTSEWSGVVPLTTVPIPPTATVPPATAPPQAEDDPSVVARPVPAEAPPAPPPAAPPPPWAASTQRTSANLVSVDVGCADDLDSAALDRFFAQRVGPVLGWDYQHVTALGGDRYLWLFQDVFLDHSGTATTLGRAGFVHNAALLQEGRCFRLLHGGSPTAPQAFEPGTGTRNLSTWFWPMGGEVHDGSVVVVWAQMVKDAVDPRPPDGLGWHPSQTWIATYDPVTLGRLDFRPAPNSGVTPIYGYALASDATHTYLFGNSFEQNLAREGGYWAGRHSATNVYVARVPRGDVFSPPEYRTADGWSPDPARAAPILTRHWAEFPLQPRWIDGQWVAVAAVDGYWSEGYSVDVARDPWGPWTTVESRRVGPRGDDPKMNTYHAHLLPWRSSTGELVVSMSNNARNMGRDAWPRPDRYRPTVFTSPWMPAPAVAPTTTLPATTALVPTTLAAPTTLATTTTAAATSTTAATTTSTTAATTTSTTTATTTSPASTTTSTTTSPASTITSLTTTTSPTTTSSTTTTSSSTTSSTTATTQATRPTDRP